MHSTHPIRFLLTLLTLLTLTSLATSTSILHPSKFRKVDQQLRAEVIEGIYSNTEPFLLETHLNISLSQLPSIDNATLPIFNTTVIFKLPFAVERSLGVVVRRLYLDDPMGFRMRARRRAERRERYRDFVDFVDDEDKRLTMNATLTATATAIPTAVQERIDKVLSSVDARLSRAATATRTGERQWYATKVMKSLISDAMVSNLPAVTTAAAAGGGSFSYDTRTTSYSALGGVEAFVTSYVVLQAVETSSATGNSVGGSASVGNAGAAPTATSTTGGAGRSDLKGVGTLGLVGFVIQALL